MNEKDDLDRFTLIMLGMADNFRDSITKEGMSMRFDMLKDYSMSQIEIAARAIMATRKYTKMPPIAEFIEAIEGQEPSLDDKALIIANRILTHLKTHGANVFPILILDDDPTASWLMSHRWPYHQWGKYLVESEEQWWIKQFCAAYIAEYKKENYGFGNDKYRQIAGGIFKSIE